MSTDEFDRFLSEHHPENADSVLTSQQVTIVIDTIDTLVRTAMGSLNQIVLTCTRVQDDETYVWAATVHGTTIMVDTLEEFVSAVARLAQGG